MSAAVDRRALLGGGLGLGLAAGLGAAVAAGRPAGAGTSGGALRIGYLPITDASPLLVAHRRGLYDRFGVRVARPVRFRSWAELAQAFVARKVDVVHLLAPFAVQLRYGLGAPVRMLAWNHTNGSSITLANGITDLGGLAGRTFAIPYWWSIHNIIAQRLFRAGGLRPVLRRNPCRSRGEVRLVVMSPSDMLPAMSNGVISGYVVADPFNAMAEVRGVGRIHRFLGGLWRDHACCVVVVNQATIDADPDRVQRFTDALAAAQLGIAANRPAAAAALADGYLPQPRPAIGKALGYRREGYERTGAIRRRDGERQRIGFSPFPFPSYTSALVEAMGRTLVDVDTRFLDGLDPARVHGDLVDDSFARRAIATSGSPAAFGLPASLTRVEEVNVFMTAGTERPPRRALTVLVPILVLVALWWLLTSVPASGHVVLSGFAPQRAVPALYEAAVHGRLFPDTAASLWRLFLGLAIAAACGVPLGLLVGLVPAVERATRPLFHILRMISPLSWAPVAIALFGIGHRPVYFLVAVAAVWPIMLNTAAGVQAIDPGFLLVARSLGATPAERLRTIVLPGVRTPLLTGLRLALGTAWIVIVPAEMLGVDSGLGYAILNARDQLAFDRLMAVILWIGLLGYLMDSAFRALLASGTRPPSETRPRKTTTAGRPQSGGAETAAEYATPSTGRPSSAT